VALRAAQLKRKTGHSAHGPKSVRDKILWLGWALVAAGWALAPFVSERYLFYGPVSSGMGSLCILLGFMGTVWAHRSMGDAWRIGLGNEVTPLVTRGPYRAVRHPIYAFQALILIGVFLLAPTPLTFLLLFTHRVLVSFKVKDEEAHLERLHGTLYREYAAKTGALWPKLKST
jgi:protein-S-isoprenylcysteine O-methyltransferase Ste14